MRNVKNFRRTAVLLKSPRGEEYMECQIDPKLVVKILIGSVLFLLFAHIVGLISKFYFHHDRVYGLVPFFALYGEQNLSTYYQSFALLTSSLLLGLIGVLEKRNNRKSRYWFGLFGIFLFLSIDEFTAVHESLVHPFRALFNASGVLYYAWVIPYFFLVLVVGALYLKFLLGLEKKTRNLFIVAGFLYVLGALGFELVDGYLASQGVQDLRIYIAGTIEELLEKLGIIVFIFSLLDYLGNHYGDFRISIKHGT